jgi:transposase-like protein
MTQDMLRRPLVIGGPGKTVEVDESLWSKMRKYNVGRIPPVRPWIFGAIERESKQVVLLVLDGRKEEDLIPKIQKHVAPGTTVITDCWAAYNSLGTHGYHHQTVNHSHNFVDPVTGAHTQTIEGFWAHGKQPFKVAYGFPLDQLTSHLDEITWRWNNKEVNTFDRLLELIAEFYPC